MAIEDEIINISDIDKGTEILNTDKLIIETNNGTRLLDFKDLVIGEDNITFRDKLVQGTDATGSSSTAFTSVTGFNILTSDTTAGHLTKYADISGTIELGKFNYNGIASWASLSGDVAVHQSEIDTLKSQFTDIQTVFSSSSALSSTQLTLSAVNWKASGGSRSRYLEFAKFDLDPVDTNASVTSELKPLKIVYPNDGSYVASWILFLGRFTAKREGRRIVRIYRTSASTGAQDAIWEGQFPTPSHGSGEKSSIDINHIEYIRPGDTIVVTGNDEISLLDSSNIAGIKIS